MTNANLERAKEIKYEIDDLKGSLFQITKGKLFDINNGSCSPTTYGLANPFLAQVENDIKTYAQTQILKRIESLEAEFNSL